MQRAKTTIAQRNVLVDGVRRTASRSAHALAAFNALEPRAAFAAIRHDTEKAWSRHLARLRDYAMTLDRVGTRAQLDAALNQLVTLRPAHARDSDKLRSGLERLGDANCDLEPHIVSRTSPSPGSIPTSTPRSPPRSAESAHPTRPQTGRPRPRPRHPRRQPRRPRRPRPRTSHRPQTRRGDRGRPGRPRPRTSHRPHTCRGDRAAPGGPAREPATNPSRAVATGATERLEAPDG